MKNARSLAAWLADREFTARQALPLLRIAHSEYILSESKAQLVWTGPEEMVPAEPGALTTARVVDEIINQTKRQLIVAGYYVSETTLRRYGLEKMSDSIQIVVIVDAGTVELRDAVDLRRMGVTVVQVANIGAAAAKFHVKALVSDAETALITSANFTELGQRQNVELGVLLSGKLATQAASQLMRIAASRRCLDTKLEFVQVDS